MRYSVAFRVITATGFLLALGAFSQRVWIGLRADLRWRSICLGCSSKADVADGPQPPLTTAFRRCGAARETGPWSIAQHLPNTNGQGADLVAVLRGSIERPKVVFFRHSTKQP